MKSQVRTGLFETNSSSTHALTICKEFAEDLQNNRVMDTIPIADDGTITLTGGEFGWEIETYSSAETKANYLIQACVVDEYVPDGRYFNYVFNREATLENAKTLLEVIKEYTGCKEVIIDESIITRGYIDHSELPYFIHDKEKLFNFLFNKRSKIYTSNDNGGTGLKDMYRSETTIPSTEIWYKGN